MERMTDAPYSEARSRTPQINEKDIRQLFDITELRKTLYALLRESLSPAWQNAQQLFDPDAEGRAEWVFASRLLSCYKTSVPQINYLLESTPPELRLTELTQERDELISRLAGTMAGMRWMKHMRANDGWRFMAIYLFGQQSRISQDDIQELFMTIDQIAILTDVLRGRGKIYGIDFKAFTDEAVKAFKQYCHDASKARLILEHLHKEIDGKFSPKRSTRPISAAIRAGLIVERPPYEWFNQEFGELCKNDKTSYYAYTKEDCTTYEDDILHKELVKQFRELA